ncbi:MAG: chorismate mutase [Vampirovibrionales bacterium]|nr:chorismate mutase [Vampirovibrionales bacterium]
MLKTVRGATTVSANTTIAIQLGVSKLLNAVLEANKAVGLTPQAITGVWFTVTADITAENPARVARTQLSWGNVPMMCATEPAIEGFPPLCVRVMIQWQLLDPTSAQFEPLPRFIYLHGAATLRQ